MVLTNYELMVLVKNEVKNMQIECVENNSLNIKYIRARAEQVLDYIVKMDLED